MSAQAQFWQHAANDSLIYADYLGSVLPYEPGKIGEVRFALPYHQLKWQLGQLFGFTLCEDVAAAKGNGCSAV
jgi:hypothetical protein